MFPTQSPRDAKDLRAVCEKHGQVLFVDVNRAQVNAPIRQRTFAFVTFAHSYEADACVFRPAPTAVHTLGVDPYWPNPLWLHKSPFF